MRTGGTGQEGPCHLRGLLVMGDRLLTVPVYSRGVTVGPEISKQTPPGGSLAVPGPTFHTRQVDRDSM